MQIKQDTDFNKIEINSAEVNLQYDDKKKNLKDKNTNEFQTLMRKAVNNYPELNKIVNSINTINFEQFANYFEDENNQPESTDSKEKQKLNDDEKIVIIIENLLETIEKLGLGLGVENDSTFLYNNFYWIEISTNLVKTFLMEVSIKSGLKVWTSRKKKFSDSLYNQFLLTAGLPEIEIKSDTIKINLLNGTFTIKNGKDGVVSNHNKEDYFKYQLPFNYDPDAKAPLFQKFLNEVLPDLKSQMVLMEYCGYIFVKGLKLEKILILYGTGSNGKSVFFEIFTALLGDSNVSYYSMNKLCDDLGYYRAKLPLKLLNYASEFGGKIDIQMFKRLISGEPVEARLPYGEPLVISNYCKFIFNANKLPEVEHTDAFFRRPMIIKFSKKIEASERDVHLSKKIIRSELSGIFNLILEGMKRLVKQGDFTKSELIEDELKNYRKENNSVSLFLEEENWIPSKSKKIKLNDLFKSYQQFCLDSGQRSFSRVNFSRRLKEMNITVESGTNNYTVVWLEKDNQYEEKDPFLNFTNITIENTTVSEILNT